MLGHDVGPGEGIRQGSQVIVHSFPLAFNDAPRKVLRIKASPTKPIALRFGTFGLVTFNAGTTNNYRVGSTLNGQEILADTPLTAAGVHNDQHGVRLLQANTDIYLAYSQTGTVASAGSGVVNMYTWELNVEKTQK